jgi:hypothetical protein
MGQILTGETLNPFARIIAGAAMQIGGCRRRINWRGCIPLLDTVDVKGKDVTADALLTQRKIAE